MFNEKFSPASPSAPERESALESHVNQINDAESRHESALARLRKNAALNTVVRGALGLTTAMAVALHGKETEAQPQIKLSFTEIDPHAEAKQARFSAEASDAKHRALSVELAPLHNRELQLLHHTDTAGPDRDFVGDLARVVGGKTVVFDGVTTTFKFFDAESKALRGASNVRMQENVYACARSHVPADSEPFAVQRIIGATRNDAVRNALGILALHAQNSIQQHLASESLYIKKPPAFPTHQRRDKIIVAQAYHVSHIYARVSLSDIHLVVKEVVRDGKKLYEASVSAKGSLYDAVEPQYLTQK